MKIKKIFYILVFVLLLFGCSDEETPTIIIHYDVADIIVYGDEGCSYCRALILELNYNETPYFFRDITKSSNMDELLTKLKGVSWYDSDTGALLPVVDVKGTLLERPTYEDVMSYL